MSRTILQRFQEENGSTTCEDLKGAKDGHPLCSCTKCVHEGSTDCVGVFVISTGQLKAYVRSEEGKQVTVWRLLDGDVCLMGVESRVPSGGMFVVPTMTNPGWALVALLAGSCVTAALLVLIKKPLKPEEIDDIGAEKAEEEVDLSGLSFS